MFSSKGTRQRCRRAYVTSWLTAGMLVLGSAFTGVAYAQVSFNGTRGLLRTKAADTVGKGYLDFQLGTHFQKLGDQSLTEGGFFPVDGLGDAVVDYYFFITRVNLTYGLSEYFEVAASFDGRSWVRTNNDEGDRNLDTVTRGGAGDTDISAKISIPMPSGDHIKLGAVGTFSFPTGKDSRGFSTESTDILAMGLATLDFTDMESFVPTRLHVNVGKRWNRNEDDGFGLFDPEMPDSFGFYPPAYPAIPVDGSGEKTEDDSYNDIMVFNAAIEFPAPSVVFFVEFNWEWFNNIDDADIADSLSKNTYTLSPGVAFLSQGGTSLKFGGDINLNSGDKPSLLGVPDWGLWFSIGYNAEIIPKDTDRDGIKDHDDACIDQPEDFDGFEDEDGCPDLDNDGDGIADGQDDCPDLAEDFDGFEDEDGCPDLDNDQDGIPDTEDRCPNEPEDFDGEEDTDGCPDLTKDSDNDGIPDDVDRCPLQAEDLDGFQDDDGCPDLDNDLDGIPDDVDNCPNSAETFNGYDDEDGCPDEKPIEERFTLKGVHFESGSAALTPDSYAILDEVVRSLQAYPEVRVEIRGHTDSQGPAGFNIDLSQKRAESCRQYLINAGVDGTRVVATGVGEEEPVSSNSTPQGRAENRRIEFRRLN